MTTNPRRTRSSTSIPKPAKFELERPHLLQHLEQTSDVPLVALLAPAGYGKTTLLAQWARTSSRKCIWLTLQGEHLDVARLCAAVGLACHELFSRNAWKLWLKLLEQSATPQALLQALIKQFTAFDHDVDLILDHLERLGTDGGKWLASLLDQLPEGHRLILAGYDGSLLPLQRYLSEDRARVLQMEHLAFNLQETTDCLKLRKSPLEPNQLQEQLGGWAAGIVLCSLGGPQQNNAQDYILEVFKRLPATIQEVLPQLAVFEQWSEATTHDLQISLPQGWLNQLVKTGLPLSPLGKGIYKAHTLLLEAMKQELAGNPIHFARAHNHAAQITEARGELLTAFHHFIALQNIPEALRLARVLVDDYILTFRHSLIRQVLENFTLEQMDEHLKLRYGFALLNTGEKDKSQEIGHYLYDRESKHPNTFILIAANNIYSGRLLEAIEYLDKGIEICAEDKYFSALFKIKSSIYSHLDEKQNSLDFAKKGLESAKKSGMAQFILEAEIALAVSYGRFGETYQRDVLFNKLIKNSLNQSANRVYCELSLNYALFLINEGLFSKSEELIVNCLSHINDRKDMLFAVAYYFTSFKYFLEGNHTSQILEIDKFILSNAFHQIDFYICHMCYWVVVAGFMTNNLETAHQFLEKLSKIYEPNTNEEVVGFLEELGAVSFFYHKNYQKAKEALIISRSKLSAKDVGYIRFTCYLAEIKRIQEGITLEDIQEIIDLLDFMPFKRDFVLKIDLALLRPLYEECVARGWYPERFQAILEAPILPVPTKPKLQIQTHPRFKVQLQDSPLELPLSKAEEVLLWLAIHGTATRDEIVGAVWGDATDPKNTQYFRTVARRLRQTLSSHPASPGDALPFEHGTYQIHEALEVELDMAPLLDALEEPPTDAAELKKALECYPKTLMKGCESVWLEKLREQLESGSHRLTHVLASQLEQTDCSTAIWAYELALELHPYDVEAMHSLAKLHHAQGKPLEAQNYLARAGETGQNPVLKYALN